MSSSRSHLAIVNRGRFPVFKTNHHETAAAQITGGRVCHCEREGYSNSSIDSVTTTLHDVDSDTRRDFICRGHHSMSRPHRLPSRSELGEGSAKHDERKNNW